MLTVVQSLQRALRPYVRVETIGKDGLISVLNRKDGVNEDWRLDCLHSLCREVRIFPTVSS